MGSICCTKGLALSPEGNFHGKSFSAVSVQKQKLFRNFHSFDSLYSLEKNKLGFGSYGDVKLCTDKQMQISKAVKIINKDYLRTANIENAWFYNKIDILNKLDHPLIVSFYEFFEERDYFYLLMDYHQEGDLLRHMKQKIKLPESSICEIIHQLLIAIAYMHKQKIAHRDLKPENILISTHQGISIKLIDFDTAASFDEKNLTGAHGTYHYMAPETVNNQYDEKCDIWSLGIIMYILLSGKKNLPGLSDKHDPNKLQRLKFDFNSPVLMKVSKNAADLLKLMLQRDPQKRISAENALKHHWFEQINFSYYDLCYDLLGKILASNDSVMVRSVKKFLMHIRGPSTETIEIEKVFLHLDKNYDGLITKNDFFLFFCCKNSRNEAVVLSEEIMGKFQVENEGFISFSEFLQVAVDAEKFLERENLRNFFEFLCGESSDKMMISNLLPRLGGIKAWEKAEIESWTKYFEATGRESLDFDEFYRLIVKVLRRDI